jgi:uncharacterized protein (TIGR02466 family)
MNRSLFSVDIWKTKFPDVDYLFKLTDPDFLNSLHLGQREYVISPGLLSGARSWEDIKDAEKIHLLPELAPLTNFVEAESKTFWDQQGFFPDVTPKIYQSWVNLASSGGSVLSHSHYEAHLSAVVYISATPEQGNIVFENPMELMLISQPISKKIKKFRHEVEVTTGDVIVFPGYLRHFTLPNITDKSRIAFVANLNKDGSYYNPNFAKEQQ